MNKFQENYIHKDIIIENDDKHLFIDLEKKIKLLKANWKDKEAFYAILRDIDYQIIGENVFPEHDTSLIHEDPYNRNYQTGFKNKGTLNNNINSNNMSFISNDNSRINNPKLNTSFHKDESFITNNIYAATNIQKNILSPMSNNKINSDYETDRIKSTISTGRNYSNLHNDFFNNDQKSNINQRKHSISNGNQKVYQKRYTDVHANSKLHYFHNLDDDEKNLIEPSQWNDRTNRYFYLREQSPISNKNYQNTNMNYYNQNDFSSLKDSRLNNDLIKKVSNLNLTNQNMPQNRIYNDTNYNNRFNYESKKTNSTIYKNF